MVVDPSSELGLLYLCIHTEHDSYIICTIQRNCDSSLHKIAISFLLQASSNVHLKVSYCIISLPIALSWQIRNSLSLDSCRVSMTGSGALLSSRRAWGLGYVVGLSHIGASSWRAVSKVYPAKAVKLSIFFFFRTQCAIWWRICNTSQIFPLLLASIFNEWKWFVSATSSLER